MPLNVELLGKWLSFIGPLRQGPGPIILQPAFPQLSRIAPSLPEG